MNKSYDVPSHGGIVVGNLYVVKKFLLSPSLSLSLSSSFSLSYYTKILIHYFSHAPMNKKNKEKKEK